MMGEVSNIHEENRQLDGGLEMFQFVTKLHLLTLMGLTISEFDRSVRFGKCDSPYPVSWNPEDVRDRLLAFAKSSYSRWRDRSNFDKSLRRFKDILGRASNMGYCSTRQLINEEEDVATAQLVRLQRTFFLTKLGVQELDHMALEGKLRSWSLISKTSKPNFSKP